MIRFGNTMNETGRNNLKDSKMHLFMQSVGFYVHCLNISFKCFIVNEIEIQHSKFFSRFSKIITK